MASNWSRPPRRSCRSLRCTRRRRLNPLCGVHSLWGWDPAKRDLEVNLPVIGLADGSAKTFTHQHSQATTSVIHSRQPAGHINHLHRKQAPLHIPQHNDKRHVSGTRWVHRRSSLPSSTWDVCIEDTPSDFLDSCVVFGGHACLRLFSYSGRLASFAALSCIASSPSSREASPSRLDTVKPWLVRRSCGGQACLPVPLGGLCHWWCLSRSR